MKVRTRFAPSPTGFMHIGNLRTALYAYLFAKHYNGDFIIRLEDTDKKRYVEGATELIYKTLKETKLIHDEGPDIGGPYAPYIQSERKEIYIKYEILQAKELVENGHAYYCFCKNESKDLKEDEEQAEVTYTHKCDCKHLPEKTILENINSSPYVIRQNIPAGTTSFHDEIFGTITVENSTLDEQVLIKSDGLPTYNFCNVIDDHLMEISHIIRGKEYISSSPKYQLLYQAFGWESPKIIHLSVIMGQNADGSFSKLSKRHGAVSFTQLMEEGYLPDAIINYIALLGWSPKQTREIFTLNELVELFDEHGIVKTDSVFDYKKLEWVNSIYIKALPYDKFLEYSEKYLVNLPQFVKDKWEMAATLAQGRINKFSEISNMFNFLNEYGNFDLNYFINKKNKTTFETSLTVLESLLNTYENTQTWTIETLNQIAESYANIQNVKIGAVMWPVRIAVAGREVTPGGASEMMYLLGKDQSINRIKTCIFRLQKEVTNPNY